MSSTADKALSFPALPSTFRSASNRAATESPTATPTMSSRSTPLRRPRPANVQTNISPTPLLMAIPPSAISTSSVVSSSQGSPLMSPEPATVSIMGSSIMPSPDPMYGRDLEQFPTAGFQLLPESVLSHKTSANSLQTSLYSPLPIGQSAMQDVLGNAKPGNLMRRLSNKIRARRQSSAHTNSRNGSVGPGILRRRSDSTNTGNMQPSDITDRAVETDSECDVVDEKADVASFLTMDGGQTDVSPTSANASIAGSTGPSSAQGGPVVPLALRKGTWLRKVSKKQKGKSILLVLDAESAKITWDKSRPSKCVYVDDIKEIRTAEDIRQYRLDFGVPESEESRFFTVIHTDPERSQTRMMHLIADDDETFMNWTTTLDSICKHRQEWMESLMSFNDKAVRAYWEREMSARQSADKPAATMDDCEIDFPGVEHICRNLHIHVPQETLSKNFNKADATRTARLNFAEFQEFVRLMKSREDIFEIYRGIASEPDKGIVVEEFLRFLQDSQGESVDDDRAAWESAFTRFSRRLKSSDAASDETDDEALRMSDAGLANFLTSTSNLAIVRPPQEYSLDRPINEYIISSSHNTYLLGRQVIGISSVEGYISALLRGCRCVEIDCWDGADGQPAVVHGKTWTTRISFREVINTVNKYAFVKSRFPLWISLEVHCNPEQQRIMVKTMREIFGSKMVTEPLAGSTDRFPSPSELKDRILIKAKKSQRAEEQQQQSPSPGEAQAKRRGNSFSSPYVKPDVLDNSAIPPQSLAQSSPRLGPDVPARKAGAKNRVDTIAEGEVPDLPSSSPSDSDSSGERFPGKKKQDKIVPELGELSVYCVGLKFSGFDDPDCKMFNHIVSFEENMFHRATKTTESKMALYRHNMRHLMRVYPAQVRITSSNMNPLTFWRKGVQMAALNWQTFDLGMQLNQAMFDGGTDQSGYVLKPKEFREIQVLRDPSDLGAIRERKNVAFSIDVISAQQLMRPFAFPDKRSLDPFVEVEVFVPDDKRDKTENGSKPDLLYRTKAVHQNGFNPTFDLKCRFNITTKYPELVFVRWTVKLAAENGKLNNAPTMATFTAKLNSLKQGYRTIPLLDSNADRYLFSTLFCRIHKEPVTSVYVEVADDGMKNGINNGKRRNK